MPETNATATATTATPATGTSQPSGAVINLNGPVVVESAGERLAAAVAAGAPLERNPDPTPEERRAALLAELSEPDPDAGAAFGDRELRVARAMLAAEEHAPAWGELKVPQRRVALHRAAAFLRSGTREARLVNALLAQG